MAVEINLTPIGSGFNRSVINDNFNSIEVALTEVLGRQGVTPNSMNADIDMDGNDLLNVGDIDVQSITIDGETFLPDSVIAQGPPGENATIEVGTVTTGAAGTDVIVTNVGTDSAAVFDITIPRGDTGASGAGTGDMIAAQNLNDVADKPTSFANIKQAATDIASGVVELATDAETITGTDTTRAVTPAGVAAALAVAGSSSDVQTFSTSSVWNKPSSGNMTLVQCWGAGGSGGRNQSGNGAGGGGGGSYSEALFVTSDLTSTVAVTVGAGGAARSSNNQSGIAGGTTSFGAFLLAYGGGGGAPHTPDNGGGGGGGGGGQGGVGSVGGNDNGGNGGLTASGAPGATYDTSASFNGGGGGGSGETSGGSSEFGGGGGGGGSATSIAGAGGKSGWGGGGGGGAVDSGTPGIGGVSLHGGNGGAGATGSTAATAGTIPGGGGGGSETGNSGAGGNGKCIVTTW